MIVRAPAECDAEAIAALCGQLGYPTPPAEVPQRLKGMQGQVFVAEASAQVVGWIHVFGAHLLASPPHAEISGLVVAESHRGQGIGKQLMSAAEEWAASMGYASVLVRSNVVRERAHHFYEGLGYRPTKRQAVFVKTVEAANGSVRQQFSGVAASYARHRPRYPAELFAYLAGLAPRRELAWDSGAGSGQATEGLVPHFIRVVATDTSAAQLAAAPPHPNVEYRVAPAEASGLDPASVDLSVVAQALHWFDLDRFYAELRRVLVPGGILAVFTYGRQTLGVPVIDRVLENFYTDVVGPYWPPERRFVETGYRTLPFPFPELAAPEFELAASWTLPELLGYLGTWSATIRYRAAQGSDPVETLAQRLAPIWGRADEPRRVTWPLTLRVGRFSQLT